jgi:UDP-N-acetylmuramyl tripeptide synthase
MHPRAAAAIIAGRAAAAASRLLGRGGGTAIAGLVALRVDPDLVRRLTAQAGAGTIAVTGTNGKTTTSLMLSRIAAAAGLWPLHNRSGSNLLRGVAATLIEEATLLGAMPGAAQRLAILEVDEATLPELASAVAPLAIVFTNLFRDQLDRYGEVDAVAASWERALASGAQPALVLNADDPGVAHLGRSYAGRVIYYGIEDATAGGPGDDHASDFRTCLNCGDEIVYTATFYGHLGHWRCPACGNARSAPDVRVTRVALSPDATVLTIETAGDEMSVSLPLAGLYNAYNALAATAGALALGLPREAIVAALDGFSAAFGRQERFDVDGREVRVLLGKNPTGLNQVLRTIAQSESGRQLRIVFFLNDGIADGRDISWIWDADYETVQPMTVWALAAGTRAEDLALRLKYAGFGDDIAVEREIAPAVQRALDATPAGATLYVVPTYTAMLEARDLLAKRSGAGKFWERA